MRKLTQEEFEQKNKEIGAISKATYKGNNIKVEYICVDCGKPMLLKPNTVWTNKQIRCYKCGKRKGHESRRLTQEQFERKNKELGAICNELYKGSIAKKHKWTCIICGKFYYTTPNEVYCRNKIQCPRCGGTGKYNQKEFEKKNKEIGAICNELYKGNKQKHQWICTICKNFYYASPNAVWGQNKIQCKKCGVIKRTKTRTFTQQEFEQKNKEVGAISNATYINNKTKVEYICVDCKKPFITKPNTIWTNTQKRCHKCSDKYMGITRRLSQKEFEQKNKAVGAISYDTYKGCEIKHKYICIHCNKSFYCTPHRVWMQKQISCGNCKLKRNGQNTSYEALSLKSLLPPFFIHNFKTKIRFNVDWAGIFRSKKIAIESDNWFWHGFKQKEDYKRAQKLIKKGWKVLRIKRKYKHNPPDLQYKINKALDILTTTDKNYYCIKLKGWGKGKTFADRKKKEESVTM